jgi:hypothetical protein
VILIVVGERLILMIQIFSWLNSTQNEVDPDLPVHFCSHFSSAIFPSADDVRVPFDVTVCSTTRGSQRLRIVLLLLLIPFPSHNRDEMYGFCLLKGLNG